MKESVLPDEWEGRVKEKKLKQDYCKLYHEEAKKKNRKKTPSSDSQGHLRGNKHFWNSLSNLGK